MIMLNMEKSQYNIIDNYYKCTQIDHKSNCMLICQHIKAVNFFK